MPSFQDICRGFAVGMHGGGEIHGFQKTNSKESFDKWYNKGVRFFEFDVSETSDGLFVAFAHRLNLDYLNQAELVEPENGCSSEWFLSTKLYPYSTKGLKTLSLDYLFSLMLKDASILIMFDLFTMSSNEVKRFATYIKSVVERCDGIMPRLLVEIYELSEGLTMRNVLPNVNLIYAVQPNSEIWSKHSGKVYSVINVDFLNTLKVHKIDFVSFQWHYRDKYPNGIKDLSSAGFCILSHTDNNLKSSVYRNEGVNLLLVDYYFEDHTNNYSVVSRLICKNYSNILFTINKIKRKGLKGIVKKIYDKLR